MIIHRCDKCGVEVSQKAGELNSTPDDWQAIRYSASHAYSHTKHYELCGKCSELLDIPKDFGQATETIGDRLIEILEEIIGEYQE